MKCLEIQFQKYFTSHFHAHKLSWILREEFTELSTDPDLKADSRKKSLNEFRLGIRTEFPAIPEMVLKTHLQFCTSCSTCVNRHSQH